MNISHHPEIKAEHTNDVLFYTRKKENGDLICLANFGEKTEKVELPLGNQTWHQRLNSTAPEWSVPGDAQAEDPLPKTISPQDSSTLAIPSLSIVLYQADPRA